MSPALMIKRFPLEAGNKMFDHYSICFFGIDSHNLSVKSTPCK